MIIYVAKFVHNDFEKCDRYVGCLNGHHLTDRGMIPYYKYVHQQENSKKNRYHSVRYIDIDPLNRIFKSKNYESDFQIEENSDDSLTDEEINSWFKKDCDDNLDNN